MSDIDNLENIVRDQKTTKTKDYNYYFCKYITKTNEYAAKEMANYMMKNPSQRNLIKL